MLSYFYMKTVQCITDLAAGQLGADVMQEEEMKLKQGDGEGLWFSPGCLLK